MNNLDQAREKTLTKRNFNKISEDPASATRAFQLRRDYLKVEDYIENVKTTQSQFDSVESSAMQISNITKEANALILEGINGSTSVEQRKTIAISLRKMQESIVLSANSTYGDRFILGGNNTKEVPFTFQDGNLKYRGLDVNDVSKMAELDHYAQEKLFVDLGFGLHEDNQGALVESSAFNTSFPGITLLGYGTESGVPKNIVTLLGGIADALEKPVLDQTEIKKMMDQFTTSKNEIIDFVTKLGTSSKFLENTEERLKDNRISLNENIVSVEKVDLAEAITNYSWAQYAYNAALKVGTGILSQSFIDFMR